MNEKNYDFLRDQLKYNGFGESLSPALQEKIISQPADFTLLHKHTFDKVNCDAVLYFRKSQETDMYFFNKYDLQVLREGVELKQTFYIGKENNVTLKEVFNLLQGRAVNKDLSTKEGQKYNAWIQLDFTETDKNGNFKVKQYHQNYGFDLEAAVSKLPLKELASESEKEKLLESLRKGNRPAVTAAIEGRQERIFIEANPQYKSVQAYNGAMQRLNTSVKASPTTSQDGEISQKQSPKTSNEESLEKKNRRKLSL